jgi:hypothetical protein
MSSPPGTGGGWPAAKGVVKNAISKNPEPAR